MTVAGYQVVAKVAVLDSPAQFDLDLRASTRLFQLMLWRCPGAATAQLPWDLASFTCLDIRQSSVICSLDLRSRRAMTRLTVTESPGANV